MRNHGWHLPYHPLQIVAVAVFSALAFSFYVFFVPFVGSSVLKFHVIAAFSPLVLAVFILYVRCAAIDPADSGIRTSKQRIPISGKAESSAEILFRESGVQRVASDQVDDEVRRNLQLVQAPEGNRWTRSAGVCSCLCWPIVALCGYDSEADRQWCTSRGESSETEKYTPEDELLFCSLCEAEILKSSKHCRACDKCVDGFDHHCRWLNNCIGRKNYKTFVAVMIVSLLMLVMEWSVGIFVLVRCFSEKSKFNKEIVEKLGSSFTRVPFIVVVTLCTFLAMLATLPLTQLLFFHLILIKKGITTYDYIVAIREQEAQEAVDESHGDGSPFSSPTSSIATIVSGGSSSGALHRAVWCTPPRLFVDNQSNLKAGVLVQYSTSLRNVSPKMDLEAPGDISSRYPKDGVRQPRRQVGLSAWKLARLSTKDATQAAMRARENSSILRPVKGARGSALTETEDSSFESSAEISTAPGNYKVGWKLDAPLSRDQTGLSNERRNPLFNATVPTDLCTGRPGQQVLEKGSHPILPLRSEARSPYRSRSLNTVASFSLTGSATDSPDILESPDLMSGELQHYPTGNQERSWLYRAASDGYEASGGESADETSDHGHGLPQAWGKLKLNPSFMNRNENQREFLKWSNGMDNSTISRSQPDSRASSICDTRSNGSRAEANILKHVKKEWPGFRDRFPTSTDASNNSSPSQHMSPQPGVSPDVFYATNIKFPIHLDEPKLNESGLAFYERPSSEGSRGPVASKRGMSSARRLKESILSYRKGLSSSSRSGGALLSSSP